MVKPINTDAIAKGTGRPWAEWLSDLTRAKAAALSHGEIARWVEENGGVSGWWAQSIAVAFEQQIGRRVPGQDHRGRFTAAVTRILPGAPEAVRTAWRTMLGAVPKLAGKRLTGAPTESGTAKRLYWRCKLADGTSVVISFEPKPGDKTLMAIAHDGLAGADRIAPARLCWGEHLDELRAALSRAGTKKIESNAKGVITMAKSVTKATKTAAKTASTKPAKTKQAARLRQTVTPHLVVAGAAAAIDFYKKAFGAAEIVRLPGPDGKLVHAAISIGDGIVMLVDENPAWGMRGPKLLKGSPVTIHLNVADVDAFVARAVKAGAKVTIPVADQFWGDRYGVIVDPFGHSWSIATTIREVKMADLAKEMRKAAPM